MSSSCKGKHSFNVKSVSWKRLWFGVQKLFVLGFSVKVFKYFGFKDLNSLECEVSWEGAQSRAVMAACFLAPLWQELLVPFHPCSLGKGGRVRWKTDWGHKLSVIAPVIVASFLLVPFSGLLYAHICSVPLIHLSLCQKYINWCMDIFTTVSQ